MVLDLHTWPAGSAVSPSHVKGVLPLSGLIRLHVAHSAEATMNAERAPFQGVRMRVRILAAFLTVIVAAIPCWWALTTIVRLPLPAAQVAAWHAHGACPVRAVFRVELDAPGDKVCADVHAKLEDITRGVPNGASYPDDMCVDWRVVSASCEFGSMARPAAGMLDQVPTNESTHCVYEQRIVQREMYARRESLSLRPSPHVWHRSCRDPRATCLAHCRPEHQSTMLVLCSMRHMCASCFLS